MGKIAPDELRTIARRIIDSGELGRSSTYGEILEYLVECSITGTVPKEISIALDVLGRDADFDLGKDSIVRVHIYHLRNKLKAYFQKHVKTENWKLEIPKGQYLLIATPIEHEEDDKSLTGKVLNRPNYTPWLAAALIILLLLNLLVNVDRGVGSSVADLPPFWQDVVDDERPVMLVIGDYYIFGEVDETGNVTRMIREFDINSEQDILRNQQNNRAGSQYYFNLDLAYIPTSVAPALVNVMPALSRISPDRLSVRMASELDITELAGKHLIYLGYISGFGALFDLAFAASGLEIGDTFDELVNMATGERFISSSGLSIGDSSFRDYSLMSNIGLPGDARFLIVAGMRDEGLINISRHVMEMSSSDDAEAGAMTASGQSFEALYVVEGYSGTNFDSELVYSKYLDASLARQALLGIQGTD